MQQFGGLGRKKQSCLNRRCVRLKVRVCAKRKVNVSQPRFQPNKDIEILHDPSLCPPRAPTPENIRALHSGPLPTISTENVNMQQNFLVRPHDPLNPLPMPLQHHTALPGAQLIQRSSSVLPTDMNSVWDDPFMRHFVKSPESIVASHPTLALMINPTPSCTAITRRTSLNHTLNALSDKPVNDMNHVWEDPS
uniref:Uncharacterized protein n=1 Tax=Ciona savignyi TaxID=51511 RepID=H2YJ18_CIOSA